MLLLAAAVITVWKFPLFFANPRFWAEEGVVVFGLTFKEGLWAYTTYNIGYISILLNLTATLLSITSNVYYAPFVTLLISFVFQMAVISIVAFGNSCFWDTYKKKLIACAGLLTLPQAEIWLTTSCLQYWMCVGVFLIFLENVTDLSRGKKIWYRALLCIGSLNGITPCFFLPIYLVRSFRTKTTEHRIQASIVFCCSALQGASIIYSVITNNSHLAMRTSGGFLPLMHYVHKQFIWPFLGYPTEQMYENFIAHLECYIYIPQSVETVFPLIFISALLLFSLMVVVDIRKSVDHWYLIVAFVILFLLTCKFALMSKLGGRYVFAPAVILFLLLLDRSFTSKNKLVKYLSISLISVTLFFGFRQYTKDDFMGTDGPDWREEVDRWKSDCTYKPKVWPYSSGRKDWVVDMPCGN